MTVKPAEKMTRKSSDASASDARRWKDFNADAGEKIKNALFAMEKERSK